MNFKIISIGKFPKNSPYIKLFEKYKKRIRSKIELIEIKNEKEASKNFVLQKSIIDKNKYLEKEIILLDKTGTNFSSEGFSKFLEKKNG